MATTATLKATCGIRYRHHSVAPHSGGGEREEQEGGGVQDTGWGQRGRALAAAKPAQPTNPQPKAAAKAAAQSRSPKPAAAQSRSPKPAAEPQTGRQAGVRQGVRQRAAPRGSAKGQGQGAAPRGSAKEQRQGSAPRRGGHFQGNREISRTCLPPVVLTEPMIGGRAPIFAAVGVEPIRNSDIPTTTFSPPLGLARGARSLGARVGGAIGAQYGGDTRKPTRRCNAGTPGPLHWAPSFSSRQPQ